MQNILFLNRKTVSEAEVKRIGEHLIQIKGDFAKNTSGFHLLNSAGAVFGKYEDYTTLYQEIEGGFILSNDGSVYIEPQPTPDPEPYVPTLEELQEAKVAEMDIAQRSAIQQGIDVVLSDGASEHFDLSGDEQTKLLGLQGKVLEGETAIPWHTSDEAEHCKFYSNADMKKIVETALFHVTYHTTYFRDLRIYIRSLQDKAQVEVVKYGVEIPEDYQSEPLKAMKAGV